MRLNQFFIPISVDTYSAYLVNQSSGDYSDGDTPLPIPNREVKPASADGTVPKGGTGE